MTDLRPLRDILKKNLRILFVGHSPGVSSSQARHYFAGGSNIFWRLLYESGLTKNRLTFKDDKSLLRQGYGLTDVVKKPAKNVNEAKRQYKPGDTKRLDRLLATFTPKIVAFVGKTSLRTYDQKHYTKLNYGFQYRHNDVRMYLVPSTSGLSYGDTKYGEKLNWYKALKRYSDGLR